MKRITIGFFVLFFLFSIFTAAHSKEELGVHFFYSKICPHCAAEEIFLDAIEEKYPEISIYRHDVADLETREILEAMCRECGIEEYIGSVPLTFIGKEVVVGFDNDQNKGREIEESIQRMIEGEEGFSVKKISLPLIGEIDPGDYSFPALAVLLGLLDGFNVCSLGTLILILGLVIVLRSRKKIVLFGGTFIVVTSLIYGLLILLWYKLFFVLASYLGVMELIIGLLGIGGGVFFLREFLKFRKYGPACQTEKGQGTISKLAGKLQSSFLNQKGMVFLVAAVLLFAVVVTVVEFPCSAAVPLTFASIMAEAGLPLFEYLFYIALYVIFYMIDEIIVFMIAVFKMSIWMASGRFVTWITFAEAVILFSLGAYYLANVF
jgi:glutaredoxin-related protein